MTFPEPPSEGNVSLRAINKCLIQICRFLPSLRVVLTDSGSVSKTSLGQIVKFKGGGGVAASSSTYRGEWISTYPNGYAIYDTVNITGGGTAGLYISLVNNNTSVPGESSTWKQQANNNAARMFT